MEEKKEVIIQPQITTDGAGVDDFTITGTGGVENVVPKETDTEDGRRALVLRRAEDLCRRGRVPKYLWPGVFEQHIEDYLYFIKYGSEEK